MLSAALQRNAKHEARLSNISGYFTILLEAINQRSFASLRMTEWSRLEQNRRLAASSFYDRLNAGNGMKSELHPVCSTAACSLHLFPMNLLSRAFALFCLIAASLVSITAISAQDLPDTTRLLRFPTTNGTQIVFCYAGELYTVGKEGGTARRLTSGPGYTSFARFSPDGTQLAFTSQYDGNTEVYVMPAEGGAPKRLTTSATLGRDDISDRMG